MARGSRGRARSARRSTVTKSARTGRFVSKRAARRSRRTTYTERVGRGTRNSRTVYRSASTGRFVTARHAMAHPRTTIAQRV